MISLKSITEENWLKCTELDVSDEQKVIFPIPVVYWMAKCRYETSHNELAIHSGDQLVGFCVWGKDPDDGKLWIVSIMIDSQFQKKGYGRLAVKELVSIIQQKHNPKEIFISHRPENEIASRLYNSLGFEDTGEIVDEEILRCLQLQG